MEFDPALKVVQLDRLLSKNPVCLWATGRYYVIHVRLCGGDMYSGAPCKFTDTSVPHRTDHRSQKRNAGGTYPDGLKADDAHSLRRRHDSDA